MKPITLRNVPEATAQRIRLRASHSGASLNQTVLEMLAEKEGISREEFDALAGTWSAEEANAFEAELARLRAVDPEFWA